MGMNDGGDSVNASQRQVPSEAVVEAVADAEGVRPEELVPPQYETLHEAVDPQALDALFAPKRDGERRADGRVTFEFCGYEVTVDADGSVSVS